MISLKLVMTSVLFLLTSLSFAGTCSIRSEGESFKIFTNVESEQSCIRKAFKTTRVCVGIKGQCKSKIHYQYEEVHGSLQFFRNDHFNSNG